MAPVWKDTCLCRSLTKGLIRRCEALCSDCNTPKGFCKSNKPSPIKKGGNEQSSKTKETLSMIVQTI